MWDWMGEWSGVDTPQTVMTTRAPAVLKTINQKINYKDNDADKYKLLVLGFSPVVEKGLISEYCLFNACDWFVF